MLDPDGSHQILRPGTDFTAGEQPVVSVPAGYWQVAEILAGVPCAFGSNVCAPAFSFENFNNANREHLLRDFPRHADLIMRLTRAAG
jgi:predicted cupin superfamily sugar epimerase